jgi:hypothetical protein
MGVIGRLVDSDAYMRTLFTIGTSGVPRGLGRSRDRTNLTSRLSIFILEIIFESALVSLLSDEL